MTEATVVTGTADTDGGPGTEGQKRAFFRACELGDLKKCKELAKVLYPPLTAGDCPVREVSHILETRTSYRPVLAAYTATPLHIAALRGHEDVVEFLLKECCVNINETVRHPPEDEAEDAPTPATALMLTFPKSNLKVARVLLEHGGNLYLPQYARYAVGTGNINILKLLLEYGADPEEDLSGPAEAPLYFAMTQYSPEVLTILLENGCSNFGPVHNTIDSWSRAETDDRAKIFRVLVQHAPMKQITQYLCFFILLEMENEMVTDLMDAGADVNAHGPEGFTPILVALFRKNIELAHYMVDHGADPFIGDYFGPCLGFVIELDDAALTKWVLQHWNLYHGHANASNHLLHVACQCPGLGLKSIQLLILKDPLTVEMVDARGNYPYQLACKHHPDLSVLYALLLHKPDMLLGDSNAVNALNNDLFDANSDEDSVDGIWC